MCIKPQTGYCCVQYEVCADERGALNPAAPTTGFSFDTGRSPAQSRNGNECDSGNDSIDYISIPGSGEGTKHSTD